MDKVHINKFSLFNLLVNLNFKGILKHVDVYASISKLRELNVLPISWIFVLSVVVFVYLSSSNTDGSLGRLVNDDHPLPNCKMKKMVVEGKPQLFLFAPREIPAGEEIPYNYGGTDFPWRKLVCEK